MEDLLLRHAGHGALPRPAAPRRRRIRVVAVALRARPTSLAVPGLPPAPEPVLPSPMTTVAADTTELLLAAGVPPADLRRAAGMCPELLSVPAATVAAVLRFLTHEAGVPESDLPRVLRRRPRLLVSPVAARLRPTLYFLRALGVPDLHRRADLLSFSVEEKLLPRIEFLESSLGLHPRAARSMARRFPALFCYGVEGNMRPKAEYLLGAMGRDALELFDFPAYFSYALATRIAPRHEACKDRGIRMPLPAMLRPGDAKFRAALAECVGSTPPRRRSPLWYAAWVDDYDDDARAPVKEAIALVKEAAIA